MSVHAVIQPQARTQPSFTAQPMIVEVRIRQPQHDCPLYAWERAQECLRAVGMYYAEKGLPADLAMLSIVWFRPLFTRLRLLLSGPTRTLPETRTSAEGMVRTVHV